MTDVFISYSRRDSEFVRRFYDALDGANREVWIDWESIPRGEEFLKEIYTGVDAADVFLFVVSRHSLTSEICNLEVRHARRRGKKIIPVIIELIEGDVFNFVVAGWFKKSWENDARETWDDIKQINWSIFTPDRDFAVEFKALLNEIDTDRPHMRLHTRYLVQARDWRNAGSAPSLLLIGDQIAAAEAWLNQSTGKVPMITADQREYIVESRRADTIRRRNQRISLLVSAILGLSALAAGMIGVQAISDANMAAIQVANAHATLTPIGATVAAGETQIGEARATGTSVALDVMNTRALFAAVQSQQEFAAGYSQDALILALESLSDYPTVFHTESRDALRNVLESPLQERLRISHDAGVSSAAWNSTESHILSRSPHDRTVRVWSLDDLDNPIILEHDTFVRGAVWNDDESQVFSWTDDGTVYVWPLEAQDARQVFRQAEETSRVVYSGAAWSPDESHILSLTGDSVHVWSHDKPDNPVRLQHEGNVYDAVWSADGSQVLSWSNTGAAGTVYIWSVLDFDSPLVFQHEARVNGAVWSPDETDILSWSADNTARIWSPDDPENAIFLRNADGTGGLKWSADGTRILSTWGAVRLWSIDDPENPITLLHSGQVSGAMWSADQFRVMSWTDDSVFIWALHSPNAPLNTLRIPGVSGTGIQDVIWSADENRVLVLLSDAFQVWSLDSNDPSSRTPFLAQYDDFIYGLSLSNDQTRVLSWSDDGTVRIWSIDNPVSSTLLADRIKDIKWVDGGTQILGWSASDILIWSLSDLDTPITLESQYWLAGAILSADGRRVLSWSQRLRGGIDEVRVWSLDNPDDPIILPHQSEVIGARWSSDESRVLSWGQDGTVRSWSLDDPNAPPILVHVDGVQAWSADETSVLSWSLDAVHITSLDDPDNSLILQHEDWVRGAAWSADETQVLSWSNNGTVHVWTLNDPDNPLVLRHENVEWVSGALWNTDETKVISWSDDNIVRVWSLDDPSNPLILQHNSDVTGAIWNADSTQVLSWSIDNTVRVWSLDDPDNPLILQHDNWVDGAMWNAGETQVLSWTDFTAYIWTLDAPTDPLILQHDFISGVAWNANETHVLSWSSDGTARVWTVDMDELIALGCSSIKRPPFTVEEREGFILSANANLSMCEGIGVTVGVASP